MVDRLQIAQQAATVDDWATVAREIQALLGATEEFSLKETALENALDLALASLAQGSFQVRWDVTKLLPHFGAIALPPLIQIVTSTELDEENWEYLWFAARALGEFDHPEAIATLLDLLASDSPDLVEVASDALARRGADLVPLLTHRLGGGRPRAGVIQTLAKIDHPSVVTPLLTVIQADPDRDADSEKAIALDALLRFSDPRIPPLLIQTLTHPHGAIRLAAVTGIGLHAEAVQASLRVNGAADAGLDLVALLAPLLEDLNPQVAQQAAIALGRIGTSSAWDALDRTWRSPSSSEALKQDVIHALGQGEQAETLGRLEAYFQSLLSSEVEDSAALHLCQVLIAELGGTHTEALRPVAASILINALSLPTPLGRSPQIRRAIAFQLGHLRCVEALDALIQLLAEADVSTRLHAIAALKQVAPVDARLRLETLAHSPAVAPDLCQGARFALAEW
jgi:HEAT repeat protein